MTTQTTKFLPFRERNQHEGTTEQQKQQRDSEGCHTNGRVFWEQQQRQKQCEKGDVLPQITEYERQRNERVKRNNEIMRRMGLDVLGTQIVGKRKKKNIRKKKSFMNKVPTILRRSKRLRKEGVVGEKNEEGGEVTEVMEEEKEAEETFETSAVWSYCDEKEKNALSQDVRKEEKKEEEKLVLASMLSNKNNDTILTGFEEQASKLVDESVKKGYYSIDEEKDYGLIAAAGDGGIVSIFETLASNLLMSFVAHRGWCANAQFIDSKNIVSAGGMDGKIALWNIMEQTTQTRSPSLRVRSGDIHDAGIFSLHYFENRLFTASKDKSVCSSVITEDGTIKMMRRFESFHSGVVKCVKAKSADVFATCGNDATVAVWDHRTQTDKPVLGIEDAHRCAVNFVEWNAEGDEHQIMTSAFDDSIKLWDVRNAAASNQLLATFNSHSHPRVKKVKMLYHPIFTFHGRAIVTPGEGSSSLTIYDVNSRTKVCSGYVGFDAMAVCALQKGKLALANKRAISIFSPKVCSSSGGEA